MGYEKYKEDKLKKEETKEEKESIVINSETIKKNMKIRKVFEDALLDEGVTLSKITNNEAFNKLQKIKELNKRVNDIHEKRFKYEQEGEKIKLKGKDDKIEGKDDKIEEVDDKIDRTMRAIIAFNRGPEYYKVDLLNCIEGNSIQIKKARNEIFKNAFENCLKFQKQVNEAQNVDELVDLYEKNPFGFNALSEMDKNIDKIIEFFQVDKDSQIVKDLKEKSYSFTETSLKEKLIDFAQNPTSAFYSLEDAKKISEQTMMTTEGTLSQAGEDYPEVKDLANEASGVATLFTKEGMEVQANGVLGQRDEKGRFQGLYNDMYSIDRGFAQKETDNPTRSEIKDSLTKMYNNLNNNNSFFMRWRSKSNYPDIMKEVDAARKMYDKDKMIKKLSEISAKCEEYLDYKAGDKKSKNSVLRENAVFQLNEYCKSVIEKNPITATKNDNTKEVTTEHLSIADELFGEETTERSVSVNDIQKQRENLKSINTSNNSGTEKSDDDILKDLGFL